MTYLRASVICLSALGLAGAAVAAGCGSDSGATIGMPDSGSDVTVEASADGGSDAAQNVDAPRDAPPLSLDGTIVSDGGTGEAGPGGDLTTLPCGSARCAIPAQSCCVISNPTPPPDFAYACAAGSCPPTDAGAGGSGTTSLKCSGAANCPTGTRCCVYENALRQVASDCRTACGVTEAQLCDPAAIPTGCPADAGTGADAACSTANVTDWGLPVGYATCGGIGH